MTDLPPAPPGGPAGAWARILADIAHDLRGVAGTADLWLELLAQAPDPTSRARALAEVRRGLGSSVRLAEDLADAAAVIDDAAAEEGTSFDLGVALAASHRRVEAVAQARGVTLALDLPAGFSHRLRGDESAWGRALDRILAAAVAHTAGGATCVARAARVPSGGAELSIACGDLRLPSAHPLLEAWAEPRPAGVPFPLGLWLARAHLERSRGCLEIRQAGSEHLLVAVTP